MIAKILQALLIALALLVATHVSLNLTHVGLLVVEKAEAREESLARKHTADVSLQLHNAVLVGPKLLPAIRPSIGLVDGLLYL